MADGSGERRMLSRRTFIKAAGAAGLGFVLYAYLPGGTKVALAQVPGGTLDPASVPKYGTPLLIPPVMPRAARIPLPGGKPADYYEISMRQLSQQILPEGLPVTTVWGYGAVKTQRKKGLLVHNAPSLTIEAMHDRPVRIKWINELVNDHGNYLPHLLPVDPTLHWANPPGGVSGRDTRPDFTETPDRTRGRSRW
jgi:spore coat protein A